MRENNEQCDSKHIIVELLDIGKPTRNGHIYTQETIDKVARTINAKPITIEEVAPLDRHKKKIPPFVSWPEHAMADSTGAEIRDGSLVVYFTIRNNKYGEMLEKTMSSNRLVFKPVGYGDVGPDNVVKDFTMTYITFGIADG